MRKPANNGGREAGNSIFQKICARLAVKARARLIRSGSMARIAVSTLTMTGKKTIKMATKIFG
jgi:hypothetical protein